MFISLCLLGMVSLALLQAESKQMGEMYTGITAEGVCLTEESQATLLSRADNHFPISFLAFVNICCFIPRCAHCRQGHTHKASHFGLLFVSPVGLGINFQAAAPVTSLGCLHTPSIPANWQISALRSPSQACEHPTAAAYTDTKRSVN